MNQASRRWLQVGSGGPYRATTRNWSICLLVRGHSGSHSFSSNLDWSLSSGSPAGRKEARAVTKHGSPALFTPGGFPTSRGLRMINFIFILAPFVEDLCHFYAGRVWGLFQVNHTNNEMNCSRQVWTIDECQSRWPLTDCFIFTPTKRTKTSHHRYKLNKSRRTPIFTKNNFI